MLKPPTRRLVLGALAATLLLGGCATITEDSGFKTVADMARERLGKDATWQRSPEARDSAAQRTRELLAQPRLLLQPPTMPPPPPTSLPPPPPLVLPPAPPMAPPPTLTRPLIPEALFSALVHSCHQR